MGLLRAVLARAEEKSCASQTRLLELAGPGISVVSTALKGVQAVLGRKAYPANEMGCALGLFSIFSTHLESAYYPTTLSNFQRLDKVVAAEWEAAS
jgi:hypothetical protein